MLTRSSPTTDPQETFALVQQAEAAIARLNGATKNWWTRWKPSCGAQKPGVFEPAM